MNAHIKSAWLTALASKAYRCSGIGRLVTRPTKPRAFTAYSALGVLRELAIEAGIQAEEAEDTDIALCSSVAKWAEIDPLPWMKLSNPSGIFNLAYLNKLGGGTFDLEAAAIQEHL